MGLDALVALLVAISLPLGLAIEAVFVVARRRTVRIPVRSREAARVDVRAPEPSRVPAA
jgi:hypothetical protein